MVDRGSRHPRELLSSRIDGEIEPSEARFLQAHLDHCTECRRKESELKSVAEGLARITVPVLDPGAIERLAARLQGPDELASATAVADANATSSGEREAPRAKRARAPMGLITASLLGLGVLVYVGLRSRSPQAAPVPGHDVQAPAAAKQSLAGTKVPDSASLQVQHRPATPLPPKPPPVRQPSAPPEARGEKPEPPPRIVPVPPASPQPAPVAQPLVASAIETPVRREVVVPPPPPVPLFPALQFKKKSDHLSEEAQEIVVSVAGYLREHPETMLWIEGHADGRGSEAENLALAEQRARVVADHLTSLGTPAGRIRTRSHGAGQPAASGDDRAARKANNRVELVVRR